MRPSFKRLNATLKTTKATNTINRDHAEMLRIKALYDRGHVNKAQALRLFNDYIKATRG